MFANLLQYIDVRRLSSKEQLAFGIVLLVLVAYLFSILRLTMVETKTTKAIAQHVPVIGAEQLSVPSTEQLSQFSQLFAIEPTSLADHKAKDTVVQAPRLQDLQPKLLAVASINGELLATVQYQQDKKDTKLVTVRVNEKIEQATVTQISPLKISLIDSDDTSFSLMLFNTPAN